MSEMMARNTASQSSHPCEDKTCLPESKTTSCLLNLMTIALAIGIVLVWITWDPKIVICCMALSVLRLGALFYEYPELQIWRDEN